MTKTGKEAVLCLKNLPWSNPRRLHVLVKTPLHPAGHPNRWKHFKDFMFYGSKTHLHYVSFLKEQRLQSNSNWGTWISLITALPVLHVVLAADYVRLKRGTGSALCSCFVSNLPLCADPLCDPSWDPPVVLWPCDRCPPSFCALQICEGLSLSPERDFRSETSLLHFSFLCQGKVCILACLSSCQQDYRNKKNLAKPFKLWLQSGSIFIKNYEMGQ